MPAANEVQSQNSQRAERIWKNQVIHGSAIDRQIQSHVIPRWSDPESGSGVPDNGLGMGMTTTQLQCSPGGV